MSSKDEKLSSAEMAAFKRQTQKEAKMMDKMEGQENSDDLVVTGTVIDAVKALTAMVEGQREDDAEAASGADVVFGDGGAEQSKRERKAAEKAAKKAAKKAEKEGRVQVGNPTRWDLEGLHLGAGAAAGKTADDVLAAFVRWAQKDGDRAAGTWNISKAFRRYANFADFTLKYKDEYLDTPISLADPEIAALNAAAHTRTPSWVLGRDASDEIAGCVVWAWDLGTMGPDIAALHEAGKATGKLIVRWIYALMTEAMFDPVTQTRGVVLMQSMAGCGLRGFMRLNDVFKPVEDVSNEAFYSCFPFRMKEIVLIGSPWWMNLLFGIMRLFMSKKMSKRMVNTDEKKMLARLGGPDAVPTGFPGGTREYISRYPAASCAVAGSAAPPAATPPAAPATTDGDEEFDGFGGAAAP